MRETSTMSSPPQPNNVMADARDPNSAPSAESAPQRAQDIVLQRIAEALRGLKFGQVTVTVQDGVVVQIERLERTRLPRLP